jgi:hypothetical protein
MSLAVAGNLPKKYQRKRRDAEHPRSDRPTGRANALAASPRETLANAMHARAPAHASCDGEDRVHTFRSRIAVRRRACAAAVLAALSAMLATSPRAAPRVASGTSASASIAVTNCEDSGPGSLRDAVASAVSGDTVDLGGLACSTITLTSGAIEIPQDDLYIKYTPHDGPRPTIAASLQSRIFHHTGHGTLKIEGVALEEGKYDNSEPFQLVDADGGCIYSAGSVHVVAGTITNCIATATRGAHAAGGGIYAAGSITLVESVVSGNTATATAAFNGGGGLFAHGAVAIYYSSVRDNVIYGPGETGIGGGIAVVNAGTTPSVIESSTIDGNVADIGGGLMLSGIATYGTSATITNSTITGNTASRYAAAGYFRGPLTIVSSTIAFNTSSIGPAIDIASHTDPVRIESSIVADNGNGSSDYDIGAQGYVITIAGSHDLVISAALSVALPGDTIADEPMLLALADNGGPTRTLAPGPGSPAVDRGDDVAGLEFDQRGSPYPRISGAAADIGAFERESGDAIFSNGFDGAGSDGASAAIEHARSP